jgi:hypothetical protein
VEVSPPHLYFSPETPTPDSPGADQVAVATNGVQRINIEADGDINIDGGGMFYDATNNKLAIGTTSPNEKLDVRGKLYLNNGSASYFDAASSGGLIITNPTAVRWEVNSSERARIDSSGRLLVGTSSSSEVNTAVFQGNSAAGSAANVTISSNISNPTSTQTLAVLSFSDNSHVKAAQIECLRDGGTWTSGTSQPSALKFSTTADGASSPTERMRIAQDGRLFVPSVWDFSTAGGTTVVVTSDDQIRKAASSIKYKTDVEDLQDSYADQILNIRPVWYRSLCDGDDPNHSYWGFIAEEVAEIDPRLTTWKFHNVSYDENGSRVVTKLDNPEPEGVAYDRFVPHLLNLVKRQGEAIADLQAEVAALKAQ